jgi:ADP-ribosylglycohydrolase
MSELFKNILFGVAIGDAYGAGIEFQDRNWIRKNINFSEFVNKRTDLVKILDNNGVLVDNYSNWDYTDDTEMTIGCIKAIISGRIFNQDLLLEFWKAEYFNDKARKGIGRHGHGAMRWLYNGERTIEEIREFQSNRPNPGNAPPMRAIPFGFVREEFLDKYARINASATHPNPKAIAASIVIARATRFLIVEKNDPTYLIPYCLQFIKSIDLEFYEKLKIIDLLPNFENLMEKDYKILCGPQPILKPWFPEGINGLPSDAMYTAFCALYILKHATNTFDGFKAAINLGGDVDSIASIVTGILAGNYGIDSLPKFMISSFEGREMLEELSFKWSSNLSSS